MTTVETRTGRYEIHCRWGALDDLGALMRAAGLRGMAFVISDQAVAERYGKRALASLEAAGFEPALHSIPPGEASKNLDIVREAYDWLLDRRAERSSAIIALGGGVTGDLAGFVAATYLRGTPFVQTPTSLLAMVDASIGGKVGVDHPRGKNLIGAFYAPRLVVQDPSVLTTLPPRSLREGFAEVIKHGFIMDPGMLDILEHDAERLLAIQPDLMTEIVARNAALKADVVTRDEHEGGLRMILNYGHTVGHAIEAVTGYTNVPHGEAISIGMMAAAEIGRRMGVTPAAVGERQARLFERYGLPLRMSGVDVDAIVAATAHDKKVAAKKVRWVLLEDVGKPVIRDDVPGEVVRAVLSDILG
jgi:3-dehydroquinate synthase